MALGRPKIVDPATGDPIARPVEAAPDTPFPSPGGRNAHRRRIDDATAKLIYEGYTVQGKGIRTLVTETGVPYGTIHARLRRAGVLRDRTTGAAATRAWREGAEPKVVQRVAKRAAKRAGQK